MPENKVSIDDIRFFYERLARYKSVEAQKKPLHELIELLNTYAIENNIQ